MVQITSYYAKFYDGFIILALYDNAKFCVMYKITLRNTLYIKRPILIPEGFHTYKVGDKLNFGLTAIRFDDFRHMIENEWELCVGTHEFKTDTPKVFIKTGLAKKYNVVSDIEKDIIKYYDKKCGIIESADNIIELKSQIENLELKIDDLIQMLLYAPGTGIEYKKAEESFKKTVSDSK